MVEEREKEKVRGKTQNGTTFECTIDQTWIQTNGR